MKTRRARSTVFVLLASIIWGMTFVPQKLAGLHMGAFTYNGVRFALGSLSLLPVIYIFEKPASRDQKRLTLKAGLLGGAVLFAASNLQQLGIILSKSPSSAGEAGFITGLYTVFTPILGLAFGRKTNTLTWIAAVLAFGGLSLISIGSEGISSIQVSDGYLVLGAVFWALHILVIDRFVQDVSPVRFTAVQFAVNAVLSTAAAFAFEQVSARGIWDGAVPILFGGIIASGAAYTLQILGQRGVEPSRAAIIFSLEALFAALSEAVLLGEIMTPRKYAGGAVIFIGIILSQVKPKRGKA
ncbi:MAG: DMT family transporter [Oscillospiraceae bacterium]|jgi:drug/metabolite transporter (DMT)-like permease|nr:DMT family transporter [Oscillospiraceae bacterium]